MATSYTAVGVVVCCVPCVITHVLPPKIFLCLLGMWTTILIHATPTPGVTAARPHLLAIQQQSGLGSRCQFSCGKDVIRDIPPPSFSPTRGKCGCRLHRAVASCKHRRADNVFIVATPDPGHEVSRGGGDLRCRTSREGGEEELQTEHGSGTACVEAAGR